MKIRIPKKDQMMRVRLKESDFNLIKMKAASKGMTLSQYIRKLIEEDMK